MVYAGWFIELIGFGCYIAALAVVAIPFYKYLQKKIKEEDL